MASDGRLATSIQYRGGARIVLAHSRPRFWLYLAGPVAVGAVYGASRTTALVSASVILMLAYFLVPANVFIYGVNDIFDAELDRLNPKKQTRERRWGGEQAVSLAVIVSGVLGVGVVAVVPPMAWPYLLGFFVLGVAYSVPPIRLKGRPGFDSIANGLYILPGAAAYVVVAGSHPPVLAVVGGWLWAMGMHTFSAVPDIAVDQTAGIDTLATHLGHTRTLWYCFGVWAVAATAFAMLDIRVGSLLLVYPLVIGWIGWSGIEVGRAYWWFPVINPCVGALLTVGGLWYLQVGGG